MGVTEPLSLSVTLVTKNRRFLDALFPTVAVTPSKIWIGVTPRVVRPSYFSAPCHLLTDAFHFWRLIRISRLIICKPFLTQPFILLFEFTIGSIPDVKHLCSPFRIPVSFQLYVLLANVTSDPRERFTYLFCGAFLDLDAGALRLHDVKQGIVEGG